MESFIVRVLISIGVASVLAFLFVRGVENMKRNHPDYKGKDLFEEDEE